MQRKSIFDPRVGERTHELLEDFKVIATMQYMALISKHSDGGNFKVNVRSAVVASTLRLSSLDYARRRYVNEQEEDSSEKDRHDAYVEVYQAAKRYMAQSIEKLTTNGRPEPTVGVFGASLVLERLKTSFFSAHFLYQMGHKYEGHAIARLILEQIAWAFCAYQLGDIDAIEAIETTRSVKALRRFAPVAGPLYGFLSGKTHIDYSSHREFLRTEEGGTCIIHTQRDYDEYAQVILELADLFGIVWELSQAPYIIDTEAIVETLEGGQFVANPDRPFLKLMTVLKDNLKELSARP